MSEAAEIVTPEMLAGPSIENAPKADVSLPGIAQTPEQSSPQTPKRETLKGLTHDSLGRAFDPNKFYPRTDKTGRWVNRHAGKGKGPKSPVSVAPKVEVAEVGPELAQVVPMDPQSMAGNATCETIVGIIQTLLVLVGEEEGVLTDAEKLMLRPSLLRIMKKYDVGADALPAEVELLVSLAGMVIERIKRGKKTATAFGKFKLWLRMMFFKAKGAQLGRDVRREVPEDLVDGLQKRIKDLEASAVRTPFTAETNN